MDRDSSQLEPVRKIVSGDYARGVATGEHDPREMAAMAGMVLCELYQRADEENVCIGGWTITYEPGTNATFDEDTLTATATHVRRRRLGLNAEQMEAEIMRLLSTPRIEDYEPGS